MNYSRCRYHPLPPRLEQTGRPRTKFALPSAYEARAPAACHPGGPTVGFRWRCAPKTLWRVTPVAPQWGFRWRCAPKALWRVTPVAPQWGVPVEMRLGGFSRLGAWGGCLGVSSKCGVEVDCLGEWSRWVMVAWLGWLGG